MPLTVLEVKNTSCPDGKSENKKSDGNNFFYWLKKVILSFGGLFHIGQGWAGQTG